MRKCLLIISTLFLSFSVHAQDVQLINRLNEYLKYNLELNFEKVMDYIHPSLFKRAPRKQLVEMFTQTYNNEQMKISIDSASVLAISPVYRLDTALYHKVDYKMKMILIFKDTAITKNESFRNMVIANMEKAFSGGKVIYDAAANKFNISMSSILFAIKDNEKSLWFFLGYDGKQPQLKTLLPQEVLTHFKF
jgi:hypothetical protein